MNTFTARRRMATRSALRTRLRTRLRSRRGPRRALTTATLLLVVGSLGTAGGSAAPADLDLTYGIGGSASVDAGGEESIHDVALAPDGSLIAVGTTTVGQDGFAVRFDGQGHLDPAFGVRHLDLGAAEAALAVVVQSDGRILVAGRSSGNQAVAAVWRLNPDGTPDTSFGGGDGVATLADPAGAQAFGTALALGPAGQVVVAGAVTSKGTDAAVWQLTPVGTPDLGFDVDGELDFGSATTAEQLTSVVVRPDGRILVTGTFGTASAIKIYGYTPTGTPDASWGNGGVTPVNGVADFGAGLTLLPDGRAIVLGAVGDNATVSRLTVTGAPDPTFGTGVGAVVDLGGKDHLEDVALLPDGGLVASGGTYVGNDAFVVKLLADGGRDSAFGTDGVVLVPSGMRIGYGVAAQADGKVLVAGDDDKAGSNGLVHRFLGVPPAEPVVPTPTCGGLPATIVGTAANDKLMGTRKADVIVALGGNDVLKGLGGNDLICAGDGNDTVLGGPGKDRLYGERGRDRLVGGSGKDRLVGGPQHDEVRS